MKNASNNIGHRFNNQFTTLMTAFEAIEGNIDNPEYIKEMIEALNSKKEDILNTFNEVRAILEERQKIHEN